MNDKIGGIEFQLSISCMGRTGTAKLSPKCPSVSIGRSSDNDIVLQSKIVSKKHALVTLRGDTLFMVDQNSTNGTFINRKRIEAGKPYSINSRDVVEINNETFNHSQGIVIRIAQAYVLPEFRGLDPFVTIKSDLLKELPKDIGSDPGEAFDLRFRSSVVVGRGASSDIVVGNPSVSSEHFLIQRKGEDYKLLDLSSTNGTYLNGERIQTANLHNGDVVMIPSMLFLFQDGLLLYHSPSNGVGIDVVGISKSVIGENSRKIQLLDNVSFQIHAGELVAVVGGSGAGKSTVVDCINGTRPATSGSVFYNRNDYYKHRVAYEASIGIVPQKDIMHDNLSVYKSLFHAASLRIQTDLSKEEKDARIHEVLSQVKLEGKESVFVRNLSGGQKKRVSIAMELLSSPKVLFLDEPTSGLSPDLDYEIMALLKDLALAGMTIIVVTHCMDNIGFCSRIAFFGKGGRLCYYNSPATISAYFDNSEIPQIFHMLTDDGAIAAYQQKYRVSHEFSAYKQYCKTLYSSEI